MTSIFEVEGSCDLTQKIHTNAYLYRLPMMQIGAHLVNLEIRVHIRNYFSKNHFFCILGHWGRIGGWYLVQKFRFEVNKNLAWSKDEGGIFDHLTQNVLSKNLTPSFQSKY